eukprot:391281_1
MTLWLFYTLVTIQYHLIASTSSESLFPISESQSFNWFDANIACNNSIPRGQLVSIHNESYNNEINILCSSTTSQNCWIGLYMIQTTNNPQWQWIDNSATNYYKFNNINPIITPNNIQSCSSTSIINDTMIWTVNDCSMQLSNAICMTCGALNELCCGIGSQCNDNNLECVNNKCMQSMEVTQIDLINNNLDTTENIPQKYDQTNAVEIATVCAFMFMFCAGVAACIDQKKKDKQKQKKHKHSQLKEVNLTVIKEVESNVTKQRERVYTE